MLARGDLWYTPPVFLSVERKQPRSVFAPKNELKYGRHSFSAQNKASVLVRKCSHYYRVISDFGNLILQSTYCWCPSFAVRAPVQPFRQARWARNVIRNGLKGPPTLPSRGTWRSPPWKDLVHSGNDPSFIVRHTIYHYALTLTPAII